MEFCLYYNGKLPSNGDKKEKHRIRIQLHPQLLKLWSQEPLKTLWEKKERNGQLNELIDEVNGHKFVPIVRNFLYLLADIEIDFLRYGSPGELVHGGDIDNRLKTLFDALRKPNETNEIPSDKEFSGFGNEPLYCLLEDDRLISNLKVNSFQLLEDCERDTAVLLIRVRTKQISVIWDTIGL